MRRIYRTHVKCVRSFQSSVCLKAVTCVVDVHDKESSGNVPTDCLESDVLSSEAIISTHDVTPTHVIVYCGDASVATVSFTMTIVHVNYEASTQSGICA
jgi:hypothetical protein